MIGGQVLSTATQPAALGPVAPWLGDDHRVGAALVGRVIGDTSASNALLLELDGMTLTAPLVGGDQQPAAPPGQAQADAIHGVSPSTPCGPGGVG